MNYDFEVKCFRKQGVQFTFMKKPGYIFIFVGLAISFLCQFLLEKVQPWSHVDFPDGLCSCGFETIHR